MIVFFCSVESFVSKESKTKGGMQKQNSNFTIDEYSFTVPDLDQFDLIGDTKLSEINGNNF